MDSKKLSIFSALAASSCCVLPLILLGLTLLGVGTAGLAGLSSTLGSVKWYLMSLAVVGWGWSYYSFFSGRKKCAAGSCPPGKDSLTRILLLFSTITVTGFLAWSVFPYFFPAEAQSTAQFPAGAEPAIFAVEGMTCGGCEIALSGAIRATGLADSVIADHLAGRAYVWYDKSRITPDTFRIAISAIGYQAHLLGADGLPLPGDPNLKKTGE